MFGRLNWCAYQISVSIRFVMFTIPEYCIKWNKYVYTIRIDFYLLIANHFRTVIMEKQIQDNHQRRLSSCICKYKFDHLDWTPLPPANARERQLKFAYINNNSNLCDS